MLKKIPIFKLDNKDSQTVENRRVEAGDIESMINKGFEFARSHAGSVPGLLVCVKTIFEFYKEKQKNDKQYQDEKKKPLLVKYNEYVKKNEYYEERIKKIKEEDIPKTKNAIDKLSQDIINIKRNPHEHLDGESGKASFIIGLIIISFLTIYLFIFYSSATFSAFFKEFKLTELGVANSIFDAQSLSKAYHEGWTELVLLLTIPFVFLGLGYLIHKFQEQQSWKKYVKIAVLILVTFTFDTILAYEITEKIYNIKAENSFQEMPSYSISLAFQSISFWMIIFAGFVVYLIWGFIFDFIMDSYKKMDKIASLVSSKKEEIHNHEKSIKDLEQQIDKLNYTISQNKTEAQKLKTILDNTVYFENKYIEEAIHRFLGGWLEWLTADRRSDDEKNKAHDLVNKFLQENLNKQIITDSPQ